MRIGQLSFFANLQVPLGRMLFHRFSPWCLPGAWHSNRSVQLLLPPSGDKKYVIKKKALHVLECVRNGERFKIYTKESWCPNLLSLWEKAEDVVVNLMLQKLTCVLKTKQQNTISVHFFKFAVLGPTLNVLIYLCSFILLSNKSS